MDLYLVVKHRNDNTGKFKAEWTDDNSIKWTECNDKVLTDCKQMWNTNKDGYVWIYRTAWNNTKETICCKARIAKIDDGGKKVYFKDQTVVNATPTWKVDNNTGSKWVEGTGGKNTTTTTTNTKTTTNTTTTGGNTKTGKVKKAS